MAKTCGISGGSGAGKTTLTRHLVDRLGDDEVSVLAFDAYYRDQGHLSPWDRALVNYDHPDSLDHERFAADVEALRSGRDIASPVYDFATHTRTTDVRPIEARPVIVAEGIHLLAWDELEDDLSPKAFTIQTVPPRLRARGDLFAALLDDPQDLLPAIEKLQSLVQ